MMWVQRHECMTMWANCQSFRKKRTYLGSLLRLFEQSITYIYLNMTFAYQTVYSWLYISSFSHKLGHSNDPAWNRVYLFLMLAMGKLHSKVTLLTGLFGKCVYNKTHYKIRPLRHHEGHWIFPWLMFVPPAISNLCCLCDFVPFQTCRRSNKVDCDT